VASGWSGLSGLLATLAPSVATRLHYSSILDPKSGCWDWIGATTTEGYGSLMLNNGRTYAHRVSYETFRGPIAPSMVIDHLCRNRLCINPDHMEVVTLAENFRRGNRIKHILCTRGHPLDGVHGKNHARYCKTCRRERERVNRRQS